MPTVFINLRHRHGIDQHVIGQKHKSLAGFTVNELDASNKFRIILDHIRSRQPHFLITQNAFAFVSLALRISPPVLELKVS